MQQSGPIPKSEDVARQRDDIYALRLRLRSGCGKMGRRESQKLDKMERIANAAQLLFGRHGYEGTTLREIANEADVALGTLSLYADDKRDIVAMLFNMLVPPLMEEGRERSMRQQMFVSALIAFFEPFFRHYANNVTLWRVVLGNIFGAPSSVHARENGRIRTIIIHDLSEIIVRARQGNQIAAQGDIAFQATSFFYLYFAAVRLWLSDEDPRPGTGIADLRAMFEQHIRGMNPNI